MSPNQKINFNRVVHDYYVNKKVSSSDFFQKNELEESQLQKNPNLIIFFKLSILKLFILRRYFKNLEKHTNYVILHPIFINIKLCY